MLRDSAYIQEREVEYVNRKHMERGEELIEPLYTAEDAEETIPMAHGVAYEECVKIFDGIEVCFHEAGHILGSAVVVFTIHDDEEDGKEKTLVFTGDLGRRDMPLLKDPYQPEKADYLLTESTYGNRVHESIKEAEDELAEIVTKTVARGGKIIIPAFSLGRTQEVIYALHKNVR